jgi:hypothetical protein
LQVRCHSVVIKQRVVYIEQENDPSWRLFACIHFCVTRGLVALIAKMHRARHAKMQHQHG